MLKVDNLHAYYGKSHVLHGVNFSVGQGEIVALLGRNGSGRSTTAKAIMGLVECQGTIDWKGQAIQGKKAYEIAHLGIGYVPENRDIFPNCSRHRQSISHGDHRKNLFIPIDIQGLITCIFKNDDAVFHNESPSEIR